MAPAGWPCSARRSLLPELRRALGDARARPGRPAGPGGAGPGRRPGGAAGRRGQRPRVRLRGGRGAVPDGRSGRRAAGEGPPVATTRGLRTLYVALHPTDPAAGRRARRAAPRRRCADLGLRALTAQPRQVRSVGVGASRRGRLEMRCDPGCLGGGPRARQDRPRPAADAGHRRHDLARVRADVLQRPLRRLLHHPRQHLGPWPPAGTQLDTLQAGIFTPSSCRRASPCSTPCARSSGAGGARPGAGSS